MEDKLIKNRLVGKKRIYLDMFENAIIGWVDWAYFINGEIEARSVGLGTGENYLTPKQIDEIAQGIYNYIQGYYFIKKENGKQE